MTVSCEVEMWGVMGSSMTTLRRFRFGVSGRSKKGLSVDVSDGDSNSNCFVGSRPNSEPGTTREGAVSWSEFLGLIKHTF